MTDSHDNTNIAALELVLATDPDNIEALINLAGRHVTNGNFEAALPLCEQAVAQVPESGPVRYNLGLVLQNLGRFDEALDSFEQAAEREPGNAEIRKSLGMALLRAGHWERGWLNFELRFGTQEYREHKPPAMIRWNGTPSPHGTLLLYTEQGAGDAIQFIRFAKQARERVGRLALGCPPELAPLLATAEGVDQVIPWGEPLPPAGFQGPLLSLPLLFGVEEPGIGMTEPYLSPSEAARARWAETLPDQDRPRIGLVWRGNPSHGNDRNRSISDDLLTSLTDFGDADWVSLQVDFGDCPSSLEDLSPKLTDFAETAAAMQRLDLIISVDTAAAHLAGALGRPCFVLLPVMSDWRWGMDRDDTPWYPSLRLFRQMPGEGWPPVLNRVAAALTETFSSQGDR
ncbi:tetratricopeptide repeat protein [Magnetospira sp. QH-2]|uniref:tetratricopeptide repeat protein n=1 Tax=Magnetospira sp. (strain QH-2) TaxID=1288970 RepID=UPI0003E8168E|nr:tetratricopeptide repeat protein [Magnetospira sp. QH-2]CCQ73286.1 Conserved protein of unknown function. Containing TPR repeat [Magnetospira sp. QH-2]